LHLVDFSLHRVPARGGVVHHLAEVIEAYVQAFVPAAAVAVAADEQGLTLGCSSAQPEPLLTSNAPSTTPNSL
jgi:hypothetical protein